MPKYLLLKHYRGGPEPHRPVPPMDQWAPEDVEAHVAFQHHVSELLESSGEYVDAQALAPAQTWVRYGGPDAAPVTTDGPHPETSDLVAGWWMIDVDSHERAVELAAYVSSEPGPGGEPLYEWIDVREVMWERPETTDTGGMPSAATCTSSTATCLLPPRRTSRPPGARRTSPSATTWSVRPRAFGPPSSEDGRPRRRPEIVPNRRVRPSWMWRRSPGEAQSRGQVGS